MATEVLICPECGGIIGATEATDHGKPCTCFKDGEFKSSTEEDTSVFGQVVPVAKVCCQCGKDVAGKKRYRDSRGYWCAACHKADKAANNPIGVRCPDCGRIVSEGAIVEYNGEHICGRCRKDRKEIEKQKRRFGKVDDSAYRPHENKRLYILLSIFALLLVMVILTHLKELERLL
ncbi:MAG: hypothetical protein ABR964_14485 [Tepidisphaeraceae bacterium]|jgi:hypothetical protein